MISPDANSEPARLALPDLPYWTDSRRELVAWLEDRAPSFIDGYIGAVKLLHEHEFPGRVHLICHIVRDIYRNLPASLGMQTQPRFGDVFIPMVKVLIGYWHKDTPPRNADYPPETAERKVNQQIFRQMEKIYDRHLTMTRQPTIGEQLAIALYRSIDRQDDEIIPKWIADAFNAEYDFFVKRAHLAQNIDKVPDDDGLVEHFEAFERGFHSLIGPYFSGKEDLDAILQDTNKTAD